MTKRTFQAARDPRSAQEILRLRRERGTSEAEPMVERHGSHVIVLGHGQPLSKNFIPSDKAATVGTGTGR